MVLYLHFLIALKQVPNCRQWGILSVCKRDVQFVMAGSMGNLVCMQERHAICNGWFNGESCLYARETCNLQWLVQWGILSVCKRDVQFAMAGPMGNLVCMQERRAICNGWSNGESCLYAREMCNLQWLVQWGILSVCKRDVQFVMAGSMGNLVCMQERCAICNGWSNGESCLYAREMCNL